MKKGNSNLKKEGFTIIEVSLVLAIAGLIFLMMFVALPALQRQSRDTQRKEDITALVNAIKKYQSNNRGALPGGNGDWEGELNNYLGDGFEDPSTGVEYEIIIGSCGQESAGGGCDATGKPWLDVLKGTFDANLGKIYIVTKAKCSGSDTTGVTTSSNPRRYAVLYKLEGGGLYCENA